MTALAGLVLLMALWPQTPGTAPAQTGTAQAPPLPGGQTISGVGTYKDKEIGLEYTYDRSIVLKPEIAEEMNRRTVPADPSKKGCSSFPFFAMDTLHRSRTIFVLRLDVQCRGLHIDQTQLGLMAQGMLQRGFQTFGAGEYTPAANYEVAEHKASTMYGKVVQASGIPMYAQSSCLLAGNIATCWMLASGDCSQLRVMAAYRVTFTGKPAEPLIPERLTASCASLTKTPPAP